MPINPNEAPKGYRAVESLDGCRGCAFFSSTIGCRNKGTSCFACYRSDGMPAIFKKHYTMSRLRRIAKRLEKTP